MIRHVVMFTLLDFAEGNSKEENLRIALEKLEPFHKGIPSLIGFEAVVNAKEAPADNYELALICDFEDIDGLNAYQQHPVHLQFAEFITKTRKDRACIDYSF